MYCSMLTLYYIKMLKLLFCIIYLLQFIEIRSIQVTTTKSKVVQRRIEFMVPIDNAIIRIRYIF